MTSIHEVTRAIARRPTRNAGDGLTSADLGAPDVERMCAQHARYVRVLESLGVEVTVIDGDEAYPDGCFVEDTAVVTPEVAVLTRPGAPSRRGEVDAIEPLLAEHRLIERIVAPGTVDGGDVLVVGERVLIGLSARTNEAGAGQLREILESRARRCIIVPAGEGLHLKSSVNALGAECLLVTQAFADCDALDGFERVVVPAGESYAGNSLWLNDRAIVPAGFPATRSLIEALGADVVEIDVGEFRKMDGGLTCLSIRL